MEIGDPLQCKLCVHRPKGCRTQLVEELRDRHIARAHDVTRSRIGATLQSST